MLENKALLSFYLSVKRKVSTCTVCKSSNVQWQCVRRVFIILHLALSSIQSNTEQQIDIFYCLSRKELANPLSWKRAFSDIIERAILQFVLGQASILMYTIKEKVHNIYGRISVINNSF